MHFLPWAHWNWSAEHTPGQPEKAAHPTATRHLQVTWGTRQGALVLVGAVAAVGLAVAHVIVGDALDTVPAPQEVERTCDRL